MSPPASAGRARLRVAARGARGWLALLALVACTRATGTQAPQTGAVMTQDGVSMRRLGDASPHMTYLGTSGRDYVDPSPVVLWGGARPAAALFVSVETRGQKAVQRIAPLEKGVQLPGFPITYTMQVPPGASEDAVDALLPSATFQADLDGDGVQELVLGYKHGGVDVYSARGLVARYASPAARPGEAYRRDLGQLMRLGRRQVVYVLSVADAKGVEDRNLLLRVDGKGVTRVALKGLEKSKILALGGIQRPGSEDVDELVVLVRDGDRDTALARFRPDGVPVAPARRMYVQAAGVKGFRFRPATGRAVLAAQASVLVLSPDQPVNWIREIKAIGAPDPRLVSIITVADVDGDPKLVYRVGEELWAVDQRGGCFAPAGGGRWTALARPGPYLKIPVQPGARLWFVWPDEDGRLFACERRDAGRRPVTHDEWRQAAARFLPAAEADEYRHSIQPSLETENAYRDFRMKLEREERRVDAEVRTVDEWKQKLPRSFAEVAEFDARYYDAQLEQRLRALAADPKQVRSSPDAEGLRAFVRELDVPGRTTFLVVDGTQVSALEVPGEPPRELETQVGGAFEYRVHGGALTAILALQGAEPGGAGAPAFYLVEGPLVRR